MMRRWTRRGGVMITTAVAFLALLLFAGLALDFGRAHLLRAQLQTAVDASALAGALQVVPMVAIERDRWLRVAETCTDPTSGMPYTCYHWETAAPVTAQGTRTHMIKQRGWETDTAAQCANPYRCNSYRIVREWVILPASTEPVAREAFGKNQNWPIAGATIESVAVSIDRAKAEVTTTATIRVPTSFLRLIGISSLRFTRHGSAQPVKL